MTRNQRWFWMGIFMVSALVLAPLLWLLIQEGILTPLMILFWWLARNIERVSQNIYWTAVVLILGMVVFINLLQDTQVAPERKQAARRLMGPMETLARDIQRLRQGHYFYWMVANRFARLARQILAQRNGADSLPPRGLAGPDWDPPSDVQAFLVRGLQRSHEGQNRRRFFWQRWRTDDEIDLERVIAYLEQQQEKNSDKSAA